MFPDGKIDDKENKLISYYLSIINKMETTGNENEIRILPYIDKIMCPFNSENNYPPSQLNVLHAYFPKI